MTRSPTMPGALLEEAVPADLFKAEVRTWAARIIRFRPYRGKNELLERGVVSGEVYARIKDHIVAHRAQKQP